MAPAGLEEPLAACESEGRRKEEGDIWSGELLNSLDVLAATLQLLVRAILGVLELIPVNFILRRFAGGFMISWHFAVPTRLF